ncbi:hypothetical protein P0136_05025 [Lentisphaerota bacterium ZTH]|nr:hypothetical protein P0136_05025 [Lentisphaerota bacterium ZTH]
MMTANSFSFSINTCFYWLNNILAVLKRCAEMKFALELVLMIT